MAIAVSNRKRKGSDRAQSAMEYLMTYGWAILVIAIIVSILFALGLFGGGAGTPSGCTPQSGFSCTNPSYGTNGISATISQDSGQYYLGAWVFVASSSEHIGSSGLPVNFSASSANNMLYIGQLGPSQSTTFYFKNTSAGEIPTANVPVGYPFTGYIWLGYCTTPGCDSPTSFAKVGTINVKSSGSGSFGGSSTTVTSTTSTSTTSTSTTSTSSTSTTSIPYAAITLTNSQSSSTGTDFQQMINITSSTCSSCASYENLNLSNVEFTTGPANTGTVLYAWIENGTSNTASKTMIWVNLGLNAIAAGGTQTIYMNFLPMSSNAPVTDGYTGYAPQHYCAANCMQTTYGQYDNGAKVFTQYGGASWSSFTMFEGTWSTSNGYLQQTNTGGSYTNGPTALITGTSYAASGRYILDMYFNYPSVSVNNPPRVGLVAVQDGATDSSGYRFLVGGNNGGSLAFLNDQVAWVYSSGSYTSSTLTNYTMDVQDDGGTWTGALYAGNTEVGSFPSTSYSANNYGGSSTGYVGVSASSDSGNQANPINVYWFMMRSYPPGGVMPTYFPFSVA